MDIILETQFGLKVSYSAISRSTMAINLNRGKPKKYSSSNRIGSLIGNGLLTFIDYKKNLIIFFQEMK